MRKSVFFLLSVVVACGVGLSSHVGSQQRVQRGSGAEQMPPVSQGSFSLSDTPERALEEQAEPPAVYMPHPSPGGGSHGLLIIAPDDFSAALQPLIQHKNSTGMPALLLTLENIEQNSLYSQGYDIQEKIKLAIERTRRQNGIDYVMLVGDVDRFPVRYTRMWDAEHWGHGFVPSDLYYMDLYDVSEDFDYWDEDGDHLYGEVDSGSPANWSELNQDWVDLEPDVAVGRIPVSTISELETMVAKIIAYELMEDTTADFPTPPDWIRNILFAGGNYIDPQAEINAITGAFIDPNYTVYDETTPTGYFHRENLINSELNNGYGFVAYFGHGAGGTTGNIGGDGGRWHDWYRYTAFASAGNSDKLPIMLAAACDTAMFHFPHNPYMGKNGVVYTPNPNLPNEQQDAWEPMAVQPSTYDLDTMAEHALVKQDGGAIAYIGGYTGVQEKAFKILRRFFQELGTQDGRGILGDIWVGGIRRYMYYDFPDIDSHWNSWYAAAIYHHIQKMMLFGDPSLRIGGIYAQSDTCDNYSAFCTALLHNCRPGPLCRIYYKYIYRGCPMAFKDHLIRYIMPVAQIQKVVDNDVSRDVHGKETLINMETTAPGLQIEVYDQQGNMVAAGDSLERNQTLNFKQEDGKTYFLVVGLEQEMGVRTYKITDIGLKVEGL